MPTPARYWREIPQRYRLEAAKCKKCGFVFFPPRLVCPDCGGRGVRAGRSSPTPARSSPTRSSASPPQPFEDQAPYAVGIVELDDGVQLTAQVVDCDFAELKIGMRVRLEFRKISEDGEAGVIYYGYKFVPA